jgi:hypothetical protein
MDGLLTVRFEHCLLAVRTGVAVLVSVNNLTGINYTKYS